ncbi:NUMOD3 domain-containing DNA-binding protein [Clostridium perfringens]|nr:NUMOD3 domain-containing DNA-binding protein [Clostridium perfringens]
MNHYVYEITNKINGKKYIGKRTCKCPIEEDKYMGSGYLLKKAIKKHGIENFTKKILFIAESEEEAYQKEFDVIESVQAYKNPNYYNCVPGGRGAPVLNSYMKGKKPSIETRKKISKSLKGKMKGKLNPFYGKHHTIETKEIIKSKNKGKFKGELNPFYGKRHTQEVKDKLRGIRKGKFKDGSNFNAKKVINLNTLKVFNSVKEAGDFLEINYFGISKCCNNKLKTSGKINGQPARWMFYDEYLAKKEE